MPPPRRAFQALLAILFLATAACANVEKAVFLGPPPAASPSSDRPGLSPVLSAALARLPRLDPDHRSAWRTDLPSAFPWAADAAHATTWVLLHGLVPGQRYEARVCWAATSPTAVSVDTLDTATLSPALTAALDHYVQGLPALAAAQAEQASTLAGEQSPLDTVLLLRIVAAADYVAADRSLMLPGHVSPVRADIILDPFLLNVLPRSLAPTVGLVVVVAVSSAFVARHVARWLRALAAPAVPAKKLA